MNIDDTSKFARFSERLAKKDYQLFTDMQSALGLKALFGYNSSEYNKLPMPKRIDLIARLDAAGFPVLYLESVYRDIYEDTPIEIVFFTVGLVDVITYMIQHKYSPLQMLAEQAE